MIPQSGLYQFTYPTFVAKSQWVYVHFVTPDQQNAFVTYPFHPVQQAAQMISVTWFETVNLVPMEGYSPLMSFLGSTLPGLANPAELKRWWNESLLGRFDVLDADQLQAA